MTRTTDRAGERLASGLGWFSLALGVPQLLAPRRFARAIGCTGDDRDTALTLVVGVRELAAAAGILSRARPAGWLWARVAGDVKDLSLLAGALSGRHTDRRRLTVALSSVAGVLAIDLLAAVRHSRRPVAQPADLHSAAPQEDHPMHVRTAITVNRPVEDIYRFWHDFENLPTFMYHLESVETTGPTRSHWKTSAPGGRTVEWDAETLQDVPNERIAWRSLEGADVTNSGAVEFRHAPGGRGTEVLLELRYDPPGGALGSLFAKLFGEQPDQQVKDDLRRFKQVIETGEIVRTEGSPEGTRALRQAMQHPAQPVESTDRSEA